MVEAVASRVGKEVEVCAKTQGATLVVSDMDEATTKEELQSALACALGDPQDDADFPIASLHSASGRTGETYASVVANPGIQWLASRTRQGVCFVKSKASASWAMLLLVKHVHLLRTGKSMWSSSPSGIEIATVASGCWMRKASRLFGPLGTRGLRLTPTLVPRCWLGQKWSGCTSCRPD
ncbi:hypothetical protein TKK_0015669 [Trichogramma kaykai]